MALSLDRANSAASSMSSLADRASTLDSAKPFAKDIQALETLLNQLVQKLTQEQPKGSSAAVVSNHSHGKASHNDQPSPAHAHQKSVASTASHGSSSTANAAHATAASGVSTLASGKANDNFLTQLIAMLEQLLAKLEAEEKAAGNNRGQGHGQAQAQGQGNGHGHGQGGGNSGNGIGNGGGMSRVGKSEQSGSSRDHGMTASTHSSNASTADKVRGGGKVAGSSDTDELKSMGKVTNFKTSSYGPELAHNKKEILASLDAAGATPDEKKMVLSMFMVETTNMQPGGRDASKDNNTNGSKNFSSLNMNESMLAGGFGNKKDGVKTYKSGVDLNDPANIGQAAVACLEGMRQHGAGAWLAGQRGGGPAATRHAEGGTAVTGEKDKAMFENFYSSVLTGMEAMKKDPSLMTDSRRVEPEVVGQYWG